MCWNGFLADDGALPADVPVQNRARLTDFTAYDPPANGDTVGTRRTSRTSSKRAEEQKSVDALKHRKLSFITTTYIPIRILPRRRGSENCSNPQGSAMSSCREQYSLLLHTLVEVCLFGINSQAVSQTTVLLLLKNSEQLDSSTCACHDDEPRTF